MRTFILSVAFVVAASTGALAVYNWHGPGWYIMMATPVNPQSLYRGAYHTKEECDAAKPADHGAVSYECVELFKEPMSD
jgi:hypothetical protein